MRRSKRKREEREHRQGNGDGVGEERGGKERGKGEGRRRRQEVALERDCDLKRILGVKVELGIVMEPAKNRWANRQMESR